ncbi:MAG: hypothetical protein Q9201_005937 [Fulgogasparrea decipioides]
MLPASVKTASREDSIWKKLSEDEFRKNIVSLAQASNSVPADARDYSLTDWESRHPNDSNAQRRLSLDDERRIADDLAYIAASREGGEAVSAVTLEEQVKSPEISERSCVSCVFEAVVKLDRVRIHGRLRSKHWQLAQNYRRVKGPPLYQDLLALLPEMSKTSDTSQFAGPLRLLANEYKGIETKFADEDEENRLLQQAVKSSFDFWIAIAAHTTNASPLPLIKGPSLGAATLESKHIRQSPVAGVDPSAVDGLAKTQGLSPNGRTQVRAADSSNLTLNSLKERKSGSVNEAPEETSSDRQSPRVNCAQSIVDEPEAVRQPSPSTQTRNSTINPEALAPGSPRITESGSANKTPEETSSNRQSPRVYQSMIDEAEDVRQPSLNDKTQNTAVNPDGSAPYFPRETDSRFIHQPSEVMSPIPKSPRGGHDHSLGNGSEYEDLEHSPKRLLNASSDMAQISAPTFSSTTEISANALNLPLERTLSQQRPCSIQVQGFHVYFEADEPTQGRIAVKELPNDVNILASAIDVDALAPRDVVVLYRDNIKSILRLDLYRRGHQPIRIDLEWLPA